MQATTTAVNAATLSPWREYQGVYVHFPFCRQKCLYCDFPSYAGFSVEEMRAYARALCREIELQAAGAFPKSFALPVSSRASVYFGGGTPSLLPADALAAVVNALQRCGFWRQPAEATIEVNPGTADLAKLQALRALGFDRVSIGVQSLNDGELRAVGRIHTAAQALQALAWARQAGFSRVSADIIYGLPGQSLSSLRATLERLLAAGLRHISAYSLIVEEDTPLERLLAQGELQLPQEDESDAMYELVQSFFTRHGFVRYEISNYARDGQSSLHNDVYWRYLPYAAFGAAACAFNGSARRQAAASVHTYMEGIAAWDEGGAHEALYNIEELTPAQQLGEFMFMGLRRRGGADLAAAQERFGVDVLRQFSRELEPLLAQGLAVCDAGSWSLRLTERGMAVGNRVFEIFVTG